MAEKNTAAYKISYDADGYRCSFYCEVSGALACVTKAYKADSPEQALMLAWENEGKKHFNICRKCGKWIIDAVFNPEVLECTDCAPFEHETRFCKFCGAKVDADVRFCPMCKKKLHYEGGDLP